MSPDGVSRTFREKPEKSFNQPIDRIGWMCIIQDKAGQEGVSRMRSIMMQEMNMLMCCMRHADTSFSCMQNRLM